MVPKTHTGSIEEDLATVLTTQDVLTNKVLRVKIPRLMGDFHPHSGIVIPEAFLA